jgi:hypothetical protein
VEDHNENRLYPDYDGGLYQRVHIELEVEVWRTSLTSPKSL